MKDLNIKINNQLKNKKCVGSYKRCKVGNIDDLINGILLLVLRHFQYIQIV